MNWLLEFFLIVYILDGIFLIYKWFWSSPEFSIFDYIVYFPFMIIGFLLNYVYRFFVYKEWKNIKIFKRKE